MTKKVDAIHGEYFDMYIDESVVLVECPECLKEVGVSLYNKTMTNAEDGYWRAVFFNLSFCCSSCSKDTSVKIKKRKRSKIHGAYVLEKSNYDIGTGTKISRERYYDNKYVPSSSIMNSVDRVSNLFLHIRFLKNTTKFREEMDWYLDRKKITMDDMIASTIASLKDVSKDPLAFFETLYQRDYHALLNELDCTIEEAIESLYLFQNSTEEEVLDSDIAKQALGGHNG